MSKILGLLIRMKAALWVNAFCYYFRRLWLAGRWLPESVYSNYGKKKALSVIAVIIRQIIDFLGKPVYLLCFVLLPLPFLTGPRSGLQGQEFALAVQILFFLNCVLGSFGDSQIFAVTREKVVCVKYLRMDARACVRGALALRYVPFFLFYLPWMLALAYFLGAPVWQGFVLWLMLLSFRMMGEAFHVLFFDRTGKVFSRNMACEWAAIGAGLAGAYAVPAFGAGWTIAPFLLHPAVVVAYTAFGAACFWYITVGYRGYEEKFHRSVDMEFLLSKMLQASAAASFREVEIKEKDAAVPEAKKEQLFRLRGYAYLNALFFSRHRRMLVKPLYYRLILVAGIFAAAVALFMKNRELAVKLSENITAFLLPAFVFIMYSITVADKACRSMFYNCDKDLLRYSFYRRPDVILKNFKIRLIRVALYNAVAAAAVFLAVVLFCLVCGTPVLTLDVLLFGVTIFLLSVLFTAHHLCLYYVCQPYSESLRVKNPFYQALNVVMYTLCFLCLQVGAGGPAFTAVVLLFTVLYIAAALILVYRLAPRTFRVK